MNSLSAPPIDLLARAFLFLDFDGTLVTLASRPDEVTVDDALRALVHDLGALLPGRLAIVSGRPADQIAGYFEGMPIGIGGSHGLEMRWADGRSHDPERAAWVADAMMQAEALRADHPGVLAEAKPFGIALHYRLAPEAEEACRDFAERLAAAHDLTLQPGKMVFEVRNVGGDKGDAVRVFMADAGGKNLTPVFLGDDVTDEAGFRAAAALGGWGILVGAERVTDALYRLDDVPTALNWLRAASRIAA